MGNTTGNCFESQERNGIKFGVFDEKTRQEGYGPILYDPECFKGDGFELASPFRSNSQNMYQLMETISKRFPSRRAAGQRKLIKIHTVEENGKKFQKLEFENKYEWMSYKEYFERVQAVGRGFQAVNDAPAQSTIVIYAETQRDWMVAAYGAFSRNWQVVTVYATLGAEGAAYAINQTKASMIIVDGKLMSNIKNIQAKCPGLKNVITIGGQASFTEQDVQSASCGGALTVQHIDEVIEKGKSVDVSVVNATCDDIGFVMYTSGTTGNPKGVRISHKNLVAIMGALSSIFDRWGINENDVYLAYLPLAHILEVLAETACFSTGMSVGFGSPHTLTRTGLKLKVPESEGDATVLSPTVAVFAPAIMEKIYSTITRRAEASGAITKFFFNQALAAGNQRSSYATGAGPVWNSIVCKKIQTIMGGRVRYIISGSAALSKRVHGFMQTLFNAPVRQGYGLTETCAMTTVQDYTDYGLNVGGPSTSSCIRLADWEEGGYSNADEKNEEIGKPRGEILIGGHGVCVGYHIDDENPDPEMQKLNEESFIELDGYRFFRTGDIGQINKNGTLEIIDRKKDLWKGPNGEYVAFQKVEGVLKLARTVDQAMCYAKPGWENHIALLGVNGVSLEALAKELNVNGSLEEIAVDEKIRAYMQKAIVTVCKEHKLLPFEIPSQFALCVDPWTPENDCLTAANKMKRPVIAAKCVKEIEVARTNNDQARI